MIHAIIIKYHTTTLCFIIYTTAVVHKLMPIKTRMISFIDDI